MLVELAVSALVYRPGQRIVLPPLEVDEGFVMLGATGSGYPGSGRILVGTFQLEGAVWPQ